MKTIYKGTDYVFAVTIKVNDLPVDIRGDEVVAYISSGYNEPALITKQADTNTYGQNGKALFEIPKADTNIIPGYYILQVFWTNGLNKEYLVLDELVEIKNTVER